MQFGDVQIGFKVSTSDSMPSSPNIMANRSHSQMLFDIIIINIIK